MKNSPDGSGLLLVGLHPRGDEDQIRALPIRFDGGLGRVHAIRPCLVAGGLNDTPRWFSPDGNRLTGVLLGEVPLLDGRVKGVHVDVDDSPLPLSPSLLFRGLVSTGIGAAFAGHPASGDSFMLSIHWDSLTRRAHEILARCPLSVIR